MNTMTHAEKRSGHYLAAWLLYAASILGLVDLFGTAATMGAFTPLKWLDIAVYLILIAVAYGIQRNIGIAKIVYAILAIIWYIALLFFLPEKFGHTLNIFIVFLQIALTIVSYCLLMIP
jgi:hypothetical protein